MNLSQTWKNDDSGSQYLPELQNLDGLKPAAAEHPLRKMRQLVKVNMIWALVIATGYLAVIICYPYWQIRLLIGLCFVVTAWGAIDAAGFYRSVKPDITDTNLLAELKRQAGALKRWMILQTRVTVLMYPFLICGACLLGAVIGSGKDVSTVLERPAILYTLIGSIVIGTPLAYFMGQWMFKQSFGKFLDRLNGYIAELSRKE